MKKNKNVDFDEILMDAHNIPGFHRESFEGTLENPIKKQVFIFLGTFFLLTGAIFLFRVGFLDIAQGDYFLSRAKNNYLREVIYESERGIVFDRDKNPLTFNEFLDPEKNNQWVRNYRNFGFLHSIGFLTRKDDLFLARGASGLELMYDNILKGSPNKLIEEVNATGNVMGFGVTAKGQKGSSILTSISSGLSERIARLVESTANAHGFIGGAAVVIDTRNGEIIALVSFPEFDPNIFSKGVSQEIVRNLTSSSKKPFFNRAVSGLYPPGSIVKPAVAAAALAENIIEEKKEILSAGPIVLKNPFFPDKPDVFPDWKNHGWVDMKKALSLSSDIYFYVIGGGYQDQKGLGVSNILKYFEKFGYNSLTGVDLPGESRGVFPDPEKETSDKRNWSIGDTYHLSIGQGDLQVTPIAMSVYASILANRGFFYPPHLGKAILGDNGKILEKFSYAENMVDIPKEVFAVVREGMRDAVRYGTAVGLSGYPIEIAAKTGTAEIGNTGRVHSWSIGFLPYEEPKIAWAIVMENGSVHNTIGATFVASQMIQWLVENKFLDSL